MISVDDNDGQIIFGDLAGLKLPDICLTGEDNPKKNPPRKLVPTRDRTRARCVTGAHAIACLTKLVVVRCCVTHYFLGVNLYGTPYSSKFPQVMYLTFLS